jgi:hypothetical protein
MGDLFTAATEARTMSETGFYAWGTYGTEPARVAAIARWIPDAVVYVRGRHNIRDLFGYHGVRTVVPSCMTPGCSGLSPRDMERWVGQRNPDRLVIDIHPYGAMNGELGQYIQSHRDSTFHLARRAEPATAVDPNSFGAILNTEPDMGPGVDVAPVLAFDAHQLPDRHASRALLGASDKPLVLIIGEGTTPRFNELIIDQCRLRGFDHVVVVDTYPVMPLMVGADLIAGYAGYSQVEAAAVGVPMLAFENYADPSQAWRANMQTRADVETAIARLEVREGSDRPTYQNHSRRAAALITGDPNWSTVDG